MKLSSETFEKIKWFVKELFSFLKSSHPLTKMGSWMIFGALISSPLSVVALQIALPDGFIIDGIDFTANEASIYSVVSAIFLAAVGSLLIYKELSSNARHTARVLITGLPGTNIGFPEEVLSKTESRNAREAVQLGAEEGNDSLDIQITRFNSEVCVDLFNRFIVHDNCKKLYIGGLARVPFLVAYGSLLRTLTAEVVYFDKFQRDGKWKKLQEENKKITLNYDELISIPNINGDIGIAIGFTTPINRNQLPEVLKNNTTIISPSIKPDRNLIQNQINLESISYEIQSIIDTLSASENVKKIHLFLSVQSSLAIQIGRRYQEGIHRNWIVHNFDPETGSYKWAIEITRKGVSKIDS
jgi:hypothetical protein